MPISPSPSPSPSPSYSGIVMATTNSWGPYANAGDFKGNALMILSIIFCAVLLFLAFNSVIRFLFCANCPPSSSNSNDEHEEEDPEKPMDNMRACTAAPEATTMVFSKEMGTAAAECAICLGEFVEGDGIRVLPACNHVFHVKCVEKWLALRCSCPTCRSSTVIFAITSTSISSSNGSVETSV